MPAGRGPEVPLALFTLGVSLEGLGRACGVGGKRVDNWGGFRLIVNFTGTFSRLKSYL